MAALRRWQAVGGRKWMDKPCHSTLLMALNKIEGLVQDIS